MFHRLYGFTSFCQANASAPLLHSFLPLASLSPFFPSRHIIAKHTTIVKQIINVFATDITLCTSFLYLFHCIFYFSFPPFRYSNSLSTFTLSTLATALRLSARSLISFNFLGKKICSILLRLDF